MSALQSFQLTPYTVFPFDTRLRHVLTCHIFHLRCRHSPAMSTLTRYQRFCAPLSLDTYDAVSSPSTLFSCIQRPLLLPRYNYPHYHSTPCIHFIPREVPLLPPSSLRRTKVFKSRNAFIPTVTSHPPRYNPSN